MTPRRNVRMKNISKINLLENMEILWFNGGERNSLDRTQAVCAPLKKLQYLIHQGTHPCRLFYVTVH